MNFKNLDIVSDWPKFKSLLLDEKSVDYFNSNPVLLDLFKSTLNDINCNLINQSIMDLLEYLMEYVSTEVFDNYEIYSETTDSYDWLEEDSDMLTITLYKYVSIYWGTSNVDSVCEFYFSLQDCINSLNSHFGVNLNFERIKLKVENGN